jgi:hypothetical protein
MTVLMITLIILSAILWIYAFADISRSRFENSTMKFLWIIPILGSIIYSNSEKNYWRAQKI